MLAGCDAADPPVAFPLQSPAERGGCKILQAPPWQVPDGGFRLGLGC